MYLYQLVITNRNTGKIKQKIMTVIYKEEEEMVL